MIDIIIIAMRIVFKLNKNKNKVTVFFRFPKKRNNQVFTAKSNNKLELSKENFSRSDFNEDDWLYEMSKKHANKF